MKEKATAILMAILILTSTLSTIIVVNPTFAGINASSVLPKDLYETVKTSLSEGARNLETTKSNAQGTHSQASPNNEDKWNFSNPDEWSKYAYMDSNNTRLIVGVNSGNPNLLELEKTAVQHQARIVSKVLIRNVIKAVVVEIPMKLVTSFVSRIKTMELASYVEPNMKVQTQLTPNDPYWTFQWGPKKIEADWAWNTTIGNSDVLVAVVDTGIDYTHPDLAANYVPLGYDWVNQDADPRDDFGHGTHCAGIIAAELDNSIGIAGLAQVRVMAEKALDSGGGGYWDWVANAIINATDAGAKVISMSIGGYGESELLHQAVRYAYDNGVLLVAAAANDNTNSKSYPAAFDEVIAVAATDQYDEKASFSNWGDWIELAAPGVDIYSTMPTYYVTMNDWGYGMNYEYMSGTSMACPHVSGLAALLWSLYPTKSRDWIRLWLRSAADDLGEPGFDIYYGYGRINARKTIEQTPPLHDLLAYEWETPPYFKPGIHGTVNATILNFGESNENNVEVQLWANDTIVATTTIAFLASGTFATAALAWNPTTEGLFSLTLLVVPVAGETNTENNMLSKYICVGSPVKAVVLHSYGNVHSSSITNWQALNSEWHDFGDTMVYIDYTTLNKEGITYQDIVDAEADVLIISCACDSASGWQFTDAEIDAIAKYVHEGHGLIATAGTFYDGVPNNDKLAPLFGLKEEGNWRTSWTDLLDVLNTTHPLVRNVPNPFVFMQVGSALPSDGQWDSSELAGGKYVARGHYKESAIVTCNGLVYISPWLEVLPPYYRHHLQLLYNAITWSQYQRPQHELETSLQCPVHLDPGESTTINATVNNIGVNVETNVELVLLLNDTQVASLTVPALAAGESAILSYPWTPEPGSYNVTAYALPVPGEENIANNAKTILAAIRYAAVVGFVETHGESLHSEELKTYYESLGHIVTTIHSTLTPELLRDYDMLVVGEDWNSNPWTPAETTAVQDFISSGKGFVGIGDELAYPVQEILHTYGITYTGYWAYSGSSDNFDHTHPIMEDVERIYAPNPVNSLQTFEPGYWIANDAYDAYVLIAGAETNGYVLCMSDDFGSQVYSENNAIMFANIVNWMAKTYEHNLKAAVEAPDFLELGNSVMLNATVANRGLCNETNVYLCLMINDTIVSSITIPTLATRQSYTINYQWTPASVGNYGVTAYAQPVPGEDQVKDNIKIAKSYVFFYTRLYLLHEWLETGMIMNWHGDDQSWQYNLPFSFPFYGIGYSTIYISSNGLITFKSPDSSYNNDIPSLAQKLAVAPAWNDWVTNDFYDIYTWTNATVVGIRWYARQYGTSTIANFEAILSADGIIRFNYEYSDGPVTATVGISNGMGHIIAEDLTDLNFINSIVFAPFPVEHDIAITEVETSSSTAREGDIVDVTVVAENQGRLLEDFNVTAYASPANSTRILVEPASCMFNAGAITVGYRFNVTISVQNVEDLAVWQVQMSYNDTIVNVTRWFEPTWDPEYVYYGQSTMALPPPPEYAYFNWGPGNASARVGGMLFPFPPEQPSFKGNGKLFMFEFETTSIPPTGQNFACGLNIDSRDTFYCDTEVQEHYFDVYNNGYYWCGYGATPPPPPQGRYLIGMKIIENLAPGANISFTLPWNTTGIPPHEYIIWAETSPIPDEIETADNRYFDGTVRVISFPAAAFTYAPIPAIERLPTTFDASDSTPDGGYLTSYAWNFGDGNITSASSPVITHIYAQQGTYNVTLTVGDSDGLTNSTSRQIEVLRHDAAVISISTTDLWIYEGSTTKINVTITNKGNFTETAILHLYYNITAHLEVGTTITDLSPDETKELTFTWSTSGVEAYRNYTLTALVVIPIESDPTNNIMECPTKVEVRVFGDLNNDGRVDMRDIALIARAFGSNVGHERWNPICDINNDGQINMRDVGTVARNFGRMST